MILFWYFHNMRSTSNNYPLCLLGQVTAMSSLLLQFRYESYTVSIVNMYTSCSRHRHREQYQECKYSCSIQAGENLDLF